MYEVMYGDVDICIEVYIWVGEYGVEYMCVV